MPDAVTVMPRVLRAVDMYRKAGRPVIHVIRLYEADGANVGITFPNCVRATQLGATDHDYRAGLVPEACTETSPKGLDAMRGEGGQIMSLDDLGSLVSGKLARKET